MRRLFGAAALLAAAPLAAQGIPSPLGKWKGTSICTPAAGPACKNEVVLYDFRPVRPDSVQLWADKIVGDSVVPMFDLGLRAQHGGWEGEFANARVHILWRFGVLGDSIAGVLYLLPERTIGRHVAVTRAP